MNALFQRSRRLALVALLSVAACGRAHKDKEAQPASNGPGSSAASEPKEGCLACREAHCSSERAACEAEPVCARDMGCGDECKGDKACMGKCLHPQAKYAAYGQCLMAKCKSECISH